MANRFNQWANTDYVPMPVDYYAQDLSSNEQNTQQQVAQAKQIMYSLRSVTPTGNDAKALYQQVMDSITNDTQAVSKMNLKTADALSRINSVISNPEYTGKLRDIYSMTEEAKKAQEAYSQSVKDNGNDVNALGYLEATRALYNQTGDPSKFNKNLFTGKDVIPKYVEVQKELDDIISKMKANKGYSDPKTGQWVDVVHWENVDKNRIRQAAMSELSGRKDLSLQLNRNIDYDYFMQNPDDPKAAFHQDAETLKSGIVDSYNNTKSLIELASHNKNEVARRYGIKPDQVDAFIAKQKQFLDNTTPYYDAIQSGDPSIDRRLVSEKYINRHADASSDVFSYYAKKLDRKVNPYGLEDLRFAHALELQRRKQAHDKDMVKFKQNLILKTIADSTHEVAIGRNQTGDPELTAENQQKLESGQWLGEVVAKAGGNGILTTDGQYDMNSLKQPEIEEAAHKLGWNGTFKQEDGTAVPISANDYLKSVWMKQSAYPSGYSNDNLKGGEIARTILGAPSGLEIWQDGKKLINEKDRQSIFDQLRKFKNGEASFKGDASNMDMPLGINPVTGKPSVIYHDPTESNKISYIELPLDMAKQFSAAGEIMTTERNLNYKNNKSVYIGAKKYQLVRLPSYGSDGLVAFADTDNRQVVEHAQSEIKKLASVLMKRKGLSDKNGITTEAQTEAMRLINETAKTYMQNGLGGTPFVVDGVPIGNNKEGGVPFYITSDFENQDPHVSALPLNLRVGTLVPTKGGTGGVTDAKTLNDQIFHEGMMHFGAQAKFKDLQQAGTTTEKTSVSASYSILNNNYADPSVDDDE